jgi:hypothetical protein
MCPFEETVTMVYTSAPTITRRIRRLEICVQSWMAVYFLRHGPTFTGSPWHLQQWLHPTLKGEKGTWKAEHFPQLRELRILLEDMMCVPDHELWKEVWEKSSGYISIGLRPERVEVVLEITVATFCYCNEHEIEPLDCGGFVRDVLLDMARTRPV